MHRVGSHRGGTFDTKLTLEVLRNMTSKAIALKVTIFIPSFLVPPADM